MAFIGRAIAKPFNMLDEKFDIVKTLGDGFEAIYDDW